jgi:L-phenylalanine/L-methionine N-acetyltransferase
MAAALVFGAGTRCWQRERCTMSAIGHPIVIRRGEPGDADAIHGLFMGPKATAGTLQVPYPSVEDWRQRLSNFPAQDYLLVATIDGELVGHVSIHAVAKSPRRRHVAGIGMAVRDDRHRRGIGTALMRAAIELADGWLNYRRLELTVYTDNLAALALYRKFDFAIEGTCMAYAFRDGRYVDAYLMARLNPPIGPSE